MGIIIVIMITITIIMIIMIIRMIIIIIRRALWATSVLDSVDKKL